VVISHQRDFGAVMLRDLSFFLLLPLLHI